MAWRVAQCLISLRTELNSKWPDRDTHSDGMIGDPSHASTGSASDHNPWIIVDGVGVVRAYDIDVDLDGTDDNEGGEAINALAEHFRQMGANGDPRLVNGGYVIFNNRIASANGDWAWRSYSGADPHTSHIHLSVTKNYPDFDMSDQWGISDPEAGDEDMPLNGNDMVLINEAIKAQVDASIERATKLNSGLIDANLKARVINLEQMNNLVKAQVDAAIERASKPEGFIGKALAADTD